MNIHKFIKLNRFLPVLVQKQADRIRYFASSRRPVALRSLKKKGTNTTAAGFVDVRTVKVQGGKGGDGCISFLSVWANAEAGPDGGDGGNGGHVLFQASSQVNDLHHINALVAGEDGEKGHNKDCTGKNGKHNIIPVPLGTIVKSEEGDVLADLDKEGAMFMAARAGAGGRGNHFFTSATFQTPGIAELGANGESLTYELEVRAMAHVGLVGMPNAGKSTLLRAISRAKPDVSAVPFTTLRPYLGVIPYSDYVQVTVADLPGLIEGSHLNLGLGIQFLKHIERCAGLLYVIDLSEEEPWKQLDILTFELESFQKDLASKPRAIVGNKIDTPEGKDNLSLFKEKVNLPVIPISGKTGQNLEALLQHIRQMYDEDIEKKEKIKGEKDEYAQS